MRFEQFLTRFGKKTPDNVNIVTYIQVLQVRNLNVLITEAPTVLKIKLIPNMQISE